MIATVRRVARRADATDRLETFSDGVFAIVITLLVLELHVPAGRQHLASTLGEEWPRYLGYFVSFAFIGGIWVAHSTISHFIEAVDATLMRLNLVLLLFVSLLPFPTSLLASHLQAPSDEEVAAITYSCSLLAMGLAFFATYFWASRAGLFADWVDAGEVRYYRWRNIRGLGVYVAAIAVARS